LKIENVKEEKKRFSPQRAQRTQRENKLKM